MSEAKSIKAAMNILMQARERMPNPHDPARTVVMSAWSYLYSQLHDLPHPDMNAGFYVDYLLSQN